MSLEHQAPLYFYVPVICQFYILSPLVVSIAKTKPRLLLLVAAVVQMSSVFLLYLHFFGAVSTPPQMIFWIPGWAFIPWSFFFAIGVVSGFHSESLKQWLVRFKWWLFAAAIGTGFLSLFESEVIYRATGEDWRGGALFISTILFALLFVLCFLAFDKVSILFSNFFYQIGSRSYGIYLIHYLAMTFVARLVYHFVPSILAYQVLFVLVLIVAGMGIPMLFMRVVARSPARWVFRYLFG